MSVDVPELTEDSIELNDYSFMNVSSLECSSRQIRLHEM